MALVTVSIPTSFAAFSGQVTVATASQLSIRAQGGTLTQNYFGSDFTYAGDSVVSGTVTSVSLVDGPATYYTISGLGVSAVTVANYVNAGDATGLSSFLLAGNDTVNYNSPIGAAIFGYGGDDTIDGGTGNDVIDGGTGADSMRGGAGDDRYLVDNLGDMVDETGGSGHDLVLSSVSFMLGAGVEDLYLQGFSPIHGIGNSLDNMIVGNAFNNILDGGAGADTLQGGAGDTLYGREGNDTLIADAGTLGNISLFGGAGDDIYVLNHFYLYFNTFENPDEGIDTAVITYPGAYYTLAPNLENLTFLFA